jgi:hypothetical protein
MKISKASIVALTAGSVLLASTIVFATHKSTGEFTACYKKGKGTVRLIRENGLPNQCPEGFRQFKFAEQGPTGPPGTSVSPGPSPGSSTAATYARILFDGIDTCDTNSDFGLGSQCEPNPSNGSLNTLAIFVNRADYPATATYRLEGNLDASGGIQVCGRLYDYTADAVVANSQVCFNNTTGSHMWVFAQTGNISLAAGNHFYALQSRATPPNSGGGVDLALIIDW